MYGEITFRDWRLPAFSMYGYIAVDPLDPNILIWRLAHANKAGYRRVREG